ncbi:MAG: 2,3,4,5-tetrahydropyridine-2,6-dicarboxylate N-succinyltransferase [Bacteriovoracaceae bacterium]
MQNFNVEQFLNDLETGKVRAANPTATGWEANTEVKENILKVFRAGEMQEMKGAYQTFIDKHTLTVRQFTLADKVRMVPGGSSVRRGAYLAPGVIVLPPSYINIGAYVDEGTMVDSHALVGSCAQIGKRVHLSAGVQIGGVLEPVGAKPVVIEDDAFIGADSVIVEGICVGKRAVIAPGVILSKAVSLYDAVKGIIYERGAKVPDNAVVVMGSRPLKGAFGEKEGLQIYTPIIIKYRDEKSDVSLVLEDALR